MDILKIKTNYMLVSRASTGIFLILEAYKLKNARVMLPANICYAAIYPVIYSGNKPVFCDVDSQTGNITYDIVFKEKDNIDVLIAPHMYGNPIREISDIAKLCAENNILLIEDCASAMGASVDGKLCGAYGDYAIYSTGYSKTIDVGGGGIVISNRSLNQFDEIYNSLPTFTDTDEANEDFFSKFYRLVRNMPLQSISTNMWMSIKEPIRNVFIHNEKKYDELIIKSLKDLEKVIDERRRKQKMYESKIEPNDLCLIYTYEEGAVPWRFNILVNQKYHRRMIDFLLERNVPVSDWYPVSTNIFADEGKYPGSQYMEECILNFPLLIDDEQIDYICENINDFWVKEKLL